MTKRSKYRYSLYDYHAIKKADIILDGITVLTGVNGSGKSTLSRWLYYLVNGITKFDLFLFQQYVRDIQHIICDEWDFMVRDIYRGKNGNNNSLIGQKQASFIEWAENQLNQYIYSDSFKTEDIESVYKIFYKTLDALCEDCLSLFFRSENNEAKKIRVLTFLRVAESENLNIDATLQSIKDKFERLITRKKNNLYNSLHERSVSDWYDLVSYEYSDYDNPPIFFQLEEDGVELYANDSLSTIYKLNKAIYIDTPMAVSSGFDENYFWNELRDLMFTSKEGIISDTALLTRKIKDTIKGEAKLIDDINNDRELRFVSEDGKVDIELSKAATGVKTFTYLQRLLQNGFLNEKTLLLIDEPEAHLHPQWIVEYARLLVLLNKNLGVKIMIASHNPDMVSAIRYISERENVLDVTRFYLAENTENSHQYIYKDLVNDISEVFSSFNIALDRINQYGTNNN